ncbi:hypothetical protein [Compostibacter hankyongensis]|uniref:Uncharacterized protein n=1 Tax=Compostibacter hankyongensis TaxID=1007089 RepID=A0ABP8FDW8_9BACT
MTKKTISWLVLPVIIALLTAGCSYRTVSHRSGKVPPGQAKKIYGTQSAKPFAPGQQKKRGW